MKYLLLIAVFALALVGCSERVETSVEKEARVGKFAAEHLPVKAKNVQDRGNNWYTFELVINGRNHKFLYRNRYPGCNCATETITEISE